MSSLALDHLLAAPATGPVTSPAHSGRLTADEEAAAVTELTQAAPVLAVLLAECAGLALGMASTGATPPGTGRSPSYALPPE